MFRVLSYVGLATCVFPVAYGCQSSSVNGEPIILVYDAKPNGEGSIAIEQTSVETLEGISVASTTCDHASIQSDQLESLLRRGRNTDPTIEMIRSTGEHHVFYISINFRTPEVELTFRADSHLVVNGKPQGTRLTLSPGAHGFEMTTDKDRIDVTHRMTLLKSSGVEHSIP